MNADDADNQFRPPNDNAYETDEVRTGPPLAYVAEKVRHTLEALHSLNRELRHRLPEISMATAASSEPAASAAGELLRPAARYAFRSAVVGYLALQNMLALASDHDLDERLLAYSRSEFKEWLDRIDQAGSVTG
jgi:hypothetical protein